MNIQLRASAGGRGGWSRLARDGDAQIHGQAIRLLRTSARVTGELRYCRLS